MYFDNLKDVKQYANEIICFYSDNDPYVRYEVEKKFADTVATEQVLIHNGGHINSESGYDTFEGIYPEFIKLKEEYVKMINGEIDKDKSILDALNHSAMIESGKDVCGNRGYYRLATHPTSRRMKILAKEIGVPVVVLSQLSRAVEQRTSKKPVL